MPPSFDKTPNIPIKSDKTTSRIRPLPYAHNDDIALTPFDSTTSGFLNTSTNLLAILEEDFEAVFSTDFFL